MKTNKHLSSSLLTAAAALALVCSCTDKDFGYSGEDIKYAKAYQDFFGDLPEDKSWDLSSSVNHYHYDSNGNSGAATRANGVTPTGDKLVNGSDGEYEVKDNYWEVPQKTFDWMKAALKEGKDNRYLGSPFVLQLPDNDFAIIPIFQGKSSIMSELEVKVNGYEITKVWTRSENIQVKDSKFSKFADPNGWMNVGFYDGYSGYDQTTMKREGDDCLDNGTRDWSKLPMHPSYTDESDAVRSKPIYFRAKDKIGKSDNGFMYLSLHNIAKSWTSWTQYENYWDENNTWTTIGHRLTSINPQGHMLALNVPSQYRPSPSQLPNICEDGNTMPSQVIFVSCEDANGTSTDHDVNDVAFLIIGYPNAPTIVPTTEVIEKRYMCEDLGGTYDYDFNDIVVDCKQIQKYTVSAEPDNLESYEGNVAGNITIKNMVPDGCPIQTAKVARLCGTIPLQIQIGQFMFPKIKNPRNNNNIDGANTDGKYSTRIELAGNDAENDYYIYHHSHCNQCGNDHTNPSTGERLKYGHKAFTRGAEDNVNTTSGWNPNEEQIIPCHTWNPDDNNIVIYADWGFYKKMYSASSINNTPYDQSNSSDVKHNNPFPSDTQDFADFASGKKFAVSFPKNGEYPYIIATDTDVPWMKEEQHIPEEWIHGDMTARSNGTDGSNHDLIGNSFYMENYGHGDHYEGYIWSGDVTGLAGSTGVTFAKPSAELNAMDEAFGSLNDGHGYYLLHVYVEVPVGETASIGLYNSSTWEPILSTDPDGYLAVPYTERLHQTAIGINESTMHCATIYLTNAQRDYILANGVTIASRTDGVHIRKITTARPCLYDSEHTTGTKLDVGFIIDLKTEFSNGKIMSNESERVKWLYKAEEGKELSSAQTTHNNGEDARVKVPFTSHQYISGTDVTLTAIGAPHSNPDKSWKFKEWHIAYPTNTSISDGKFTFKDANGTEVSSNIASTNPLTITNTQPAEHGWWEKNPEFIPHIQLYPEFEEADNPHLMFKDGHTSKKTVTIVLGGGAATVLASSDNYMTTLAPFGANNEIVNVACTIESNNDHKITLTPRAVGETKFILYQADGDDNSADKHWGVSGELELTVKVIESIPDATVALATSMVYQWNNGTNNAYIIDNPSNKSDIKCITGSEVTSTWGNNDPIFGQQNGDYQKYVDLPNANVLVVAVYSGDIELHLNKQYGEGKSYPQFGGDRIVISETENPEYCSVILNGVDNKKTYIFDLKAVRQKYGYVHLNSICSLHSTTAKVYSMKVDNANSSIRTKWEELKGKISSATKPSSTDLINKFFQWTDEGANADIVGQTMSEYKWINLQTAVSGGQVVYGHSSSHSRHYADLTPATVLVVTIPQIAYNSTEAKEEIWFQFNKQYGSNGWGSAKEVQATDRDVCAVVTVGGDYKYVIDLDALKNKWGVDYMHLNAINAKWGDNHQMAITDVKVDAYYNSVEDTWKAMTSPVDLAKSMMHTWSNGSATGTDSACEYHVSIGGDNQSSDVVYGVGGIFGLNTYADLSSADWMKIEFEDANAYDEVRLWFNKTSDDNNSALIVNGSNSTYALRAGNSIIVKLKAIKDGTGKCHLHTIKSSSAGKQIKVKRIILDKYTAPSGGDPIAELTANCGDPVAPNLDASNKTEWSEDQKNNWQAITLNTEISVVYGTINNVQTKKTWDDLISPVKYLRIDVASGYLAPRFFFNYADGSGTDGFEVTESSNTQYLLSKTNNDGSKSYYVNVQQIRKEKGKAYLNSVRAASGNNIKATSLVLGLGD